MSTIDVIGIGSTSCVIKQPVECSKESKLTESKNIVAKIGLKDNVMEEIKKAEQIKKIDPKNIFTIKTRGTCVPKMNAQRIIRILKSQKCSPKIFRNRPINTIYEILMDYGGIAIDDLKPDLKIKYPSTTQLMPIITTEILRMLYAIFTLRGFNLSHYDIHSSNVLMNPDTFRLNLVDFGMMVEDSNIWSQFMKHNFIKKDYSHYPPELLIILWLVKYKSHLLKYIIDGLPQNIVNIFEKGVSKNNSSDLKYILLNSGIFTELDEYFLPEYFTDDSRDDLYQIRCAGLLGLDRFIKNLPKTLTRQQKLERLLVDSISTMDSYAMGGLLLKYVSIMMIHRPYIIGDVGIQGLINILENLNNSRIDIRINIFEAIGQVINIHKEYLSRGMNDTRNNVSNRELFGILKIYGIL